MNTLLLPQKTWGQPLFPRLRPHGPLLRWRGRLLQAARLDRFEGRSRFTTWAFKFGILHANVEVRRARWREREFELDLAFAAESSSDSSPATQVESLDLAAQIQLGMEQALTPHQRRIVQALLIEEVPIDVLAERMGSNRGAHVGCCDCSGLRVE